MKLELHGYQRRATDDLVRDPHHALFMDPGLGKTCITLKAFVELREELDVRSMLVIAPLRVCMSVWPEEIAKWDEFRDLRVVYLWNAKGEAALHGDAEADVYLTNPERVPQLFGRRVEVPGKGKKKRYVWRAGPWRDWMNRPDMLVIDESTKFKASTGVRTRTVKRYIDDFGRRVALTGTPTPNGLMDLHGQMLLVDGGAALDHRVTHFRGRYFDEKIAGKGARKFPVHTLKLGADEEILAAIADRVTVLRAEDWLELPEIIYTDVPVPLPDRVRYALDQLDREAATEIDDLEIVDDGPALTKARQLINGVCYDGAPFEARREWKVVHEGKLDALVDLLDELGRPALIAYEFVCEREEIAKRLKATGRRVARLGGGMRETEAVEAIRAWNAGELDGLLVHPRAAGLGLNLQAGGSAVIWFAPTWDLEMYQQLNGRLCRQGQAADRVFVYHLVGVGTHDRRVARVLRRKDATQEQVFATLKDGGIQPWD